MSQTTTQAPAPGPKSIRIQTAAEVTAQHIGQLLTILQQTGQFLVAGEYAEGAGKMQPDKEAVDSALSVFMKASDRLEKLLDEPERFSLGPNEALHAAVQQLNTLQMRVLQEQENNERTLRRPSVMLRPSIAFYPTRGWRVSAGESDDALSGWGESPQAAMAEFDRVFMSEYAKLTKPKPKAKRRS